MVKRENFNREGVPRRKWQNGDEDHQSYFVFSAQVFTKRTMYSWNREHSQRFSIHPWLQSAARQFGYFANPDRPQFFELHGTKLVPLSECIPPYPQAGDLFWVSHRVQWVIGQTWKTIFTPVEWVRVAPVSPLVGEGSVPRMTVEPPADAGEEPCGLWAGQDVENGMIPSFRCFGFY